MQRMPVFNPRPFERPTFESGKPVCPSGVQPTQGTTRVQNPDGTWKTVADGAWRCGTTRFGGFVGKL
jgi:hypothetical protein